MNILLALTFVYGVLRLLTYTKIFDRTLVGVFASIIPNFNPKDSTFEAILNWLDVLTFYGALTFQAWYWIFNK